MKPLVNVIMPAYNAEKYVGTALQSVIDQDYENIKVYVVEDCSTDNTLAIIKSFEEKYSQVTVLALTKNGGPTVARNTALDVIEGEFFTFVDSDDRLDKDHVSSLMALMQDDCAFVSSYIKAEKRNDKPYKDRQGTVTDFNLEDALIEVVGDRTFSAFCCSKMYRRSVCKSLRFNPNVTLCEDTIFCLNYLAQSSLEKVRYTDRRTYHYFKTKGSISGLSCSKKKFDGISYLKKEVYTIREKYPSKKFVERLDAWWFLMQLQFILYARKLKDKPKKKELKEEAKKYFATFKKHKRSFRAPYRRYGATLYRLMKVFM